MNIRDFPIRERPRERMLKYGREALSSSELLAIILGKGTKNKNVVDLSTEILAKYELDELSKKSVNSLRKIQGIGIAKACQIAACFEISKRYSSFNSDINPLVTCAEDAFNILSPELRNKDKEHLKALFLDTRRRLIKKKTIFIGSLNKSIVHPREIFKEAIEQSSAAVIIAHNHPSGDPTPSIEDKDVTRQLIEAGEIIGIPLLDHIVIGNNRYVSIRKEMKEIF